MFGRRKKDEVKVTEKPIVIDYNAYYLGGHPMYPNPRDVTAVFWEEGLEIRHHIDKPAEIAIAYEDMTNIETLTAENMKLGRVLVFGLYGVLWKKSEPYTVIQYKDELGQERGIAMEFGNIEAAQRLIYQKIVENKKLWKEQAEQLKKQVEERWLYPCMWISVSNWKHAVCA